jgi:hypothetical protein
VRLELNVRDYNVPLACGGPDAVSDMQWHDPGRESNGPMRDEGLRSLGENLSSGGPGHDHIDRGSAFHPEPTPRMGTER